MPRKDRFMHMCLRVINFFNLTSLFHKNYLFTVKKLMMLPILNSRSDQKFSPQDENMPVWRTGSQQRRTVMVRCERQQQHFHIKYKSVLYASLDGGKMFLNSV